MLLKVDKREKDEELYDAILELCEEQNISLIDENQDIGDYNFYNDDHSHTGIVIEYKSMESGDFYKSLVSGHLDTQMLDLDQYPHPFLIIGGKFDPQKYRGKFTRKQVLAKLASIGVRMGVKPYWFERIPDAAQFILQLQTQLEKGEKTDVIAFRHSKTRNRQDHNLNQFLSLPAVGKKRAEELCAEYKLFYAFLQAASAGQVPDLPRGAREYVATITGVDVDTLIPLMEKFTSIPGIGTASAQKFIDSGYTMDTFYEACKNREIKMGIKTCRWLEDEIWKRERQRVTVTP